MTTQTRGRNYESLLASSLRPVNREEHTLTCVKWTKVYRTGRNSPTFQPCSMPERRSVSVTLDSDINGHHKIPSFLPDRVHCLLEAVYCKTQGPEVLTGIGERRSKDWR
jgi:hypothetical protein